MPATASMTSSLFLNADLVPESLAEVPLPSVVPNLKPHRFSSGLRLTDGQRRYSILGHLARIFNLPQESLGDWPPSTAVEKVATEFIWDEFPELRGKSLDTISSDASQRTRAVVWRSILNHFGYRSEA